MTILPMNEEKRLELIQRGFGGTTVAAEAMVMGVSELQYYLIKGRKGQFTAIEHWLHFTQMFWSICR